MSTNHSTDKFDYGYLEVILGPMFSGKTTKLMTLYQKYNSMNLSVIVINHSFDKRYDANENKVYTHDGFNMPCISTQKLFDMSGSSHKSNILEEVDVVLINEGQFFEDLVPFVEILLQNNKHIYVCGLDGDFQRKRFGTILDLIPLCDKVTKLTSICSLCRKNGKEKPLPGLFSKRKTHETDVVVIGSDNYESVCRECYENE